MNLIMRGDPITIYGDGLQKRAFSCIQDSLPCFTKVIEFTPTFNGHAFNIGGILPITVLELANAVIAAMGEDPATYPIHHLADRPCEVKHAFSSYEKSVELLGYQESMGWRSGVTHMANWAKDEGPKEWVNLEPLEIVNEKTPKPWVELERAGDEVDR